MVLIYLMESDFEVHASQLARYELLVRFLKNAMFFSGNLKEITHGHTR